MSKILVIVESPTKCPKIKKILGSDYEVIASAGHIMEIPKKGLGIDVAGGFIPHYEIMEGKKDIVDSIRRKSKSADEVLLATDSDREGESISLFVYNILDSETKKKCSRITFNEITKKAIDKAIKEKREIDRNLADAQKARQVLDRLIGYKISPLLWSDVASKTSAGRVQSVALKIVCEREKEIKSFKSDDFWYIDADLKTDEGNFKARVTTEDKDDRFLKEDEAETAYKALEKAKYTVEAVERKEKSVEANPPFDTASLQSTASTIFGWDLKKTAQISQSLYEDGKVTYIRSDSFSIADEALTEVRDLIKNNNDEKYLPKTANVYKQEAAAASQEAHECIRPTHSEDKGEGLTGDDQKLYKLIRDRFIACQMSPAIVDTVVYKIKTDTPYKLSAKGQTIRFEGWMKVYKYNNAKEEVLPNVSEKELLELNVLNKLKKETQPPSRYKQGSLLTKMKKDGVGRPATYPAIMESIKTRGYVEEVKDKKGALAATDLGMSVYEYLQKNFSDFIMDIKFTAALEEDLDIIGSGKKKYLEVVGETYETMMKKIGGIPGAADKLGSSDGTGSTCPVCKSGSVVQRKGKFGLFFCCDQYPQCKAVFNKSTDGTFAVKEKGGSFTNKAAVNKEHECPECKASGREGYLNEKQGKFGSFWGCSSYPSCRAIYSRNADGEFFIKGKKS